VGILVRDQCGLENPRSFGRPDKVFVKLNHYQLPQLLNPNELLVINISSCAGVVEWQTRRTQNPVGATLCEFKSRLRHQLNH
jgi:hypothetical protein